MKLVATIFCTLFIYMGCISQEISTAEKEQILLQITNLKTAHLNSDAVLADKIYHDNLILTSQSGKKYSKKEALANIKNAFESYENSDISFLNIDTNVILTNYSNKRKFKGLDEGEYRLTVVWKKQETNWVIISMQSSKIKKKNKR
ncbi:nuclear transport factor 2 family protein [uncultured Maribacter sp.]|uniref:nuclear transport factor 2 family protein n=1 Tax=uncultured Maribacter sp. TaxID=431308 RepID=UPI00262284DD|nr:nuclear transport factor 2 family protein [uncultured Maribacter sp.]